MRSLWRSGAIFIKVLREPKKPTETLPECFDGLIRPRPRGLDAVFSTPRLGPLWPVSNWQRLQVCFALFSSISLLAFFWRSWTMRTSSCQIEFVDGAKATIRCGGQVVAECADCGILICSDCRSECCGDSFCDYCYDYHLAHSRLHMRHRPLTTRSDQNAA